LSAFSFFSRIFLFFVVASKHADVDLCASYCRHLDERRRWNKHMDKMTEEGRRFRLKGRGFGGWGALTFSLFPSRSLGTDTIVDATT
jgi:hypothetical protein